MIGDAHVIRHHEEAVCVMRALEGDVEAADKFLKYLASNYPGLRRMMQETVHDLSTPSLWHHLLCCLATHRWLDGVDCERRTDPNASERLDASIIEVFIRDNSEVEKLDKEIVLSECISDPDRRIRWASAFFLGMRGDERAIPTLANIVKSEDRKWTIRAISALGNLKTELAAQPLIHALESDDKRIEKEARAALYSLGSHAQEALLAALTHMQSRVRWRVVRVIGEIGVSDGDMQLAERLCDEDQAVRWAAAEVLANIGPSAVPAVMTVLCRCELTEPLREAAYHALNSVLSPRMQERIRPLLEALHGAAPKVEAPKVAQRLLSEWSQPEP
jgi:hypothetical protein